MTTVDNNLRNNVLLWSALLNCNLSHSLLIWIVLSWNVPRSESFSTYEAKMSSSQKGFASMAIRAGQSIAMPCVEQRVRWHLNHEQNEHSGSRCQGGVHTVRRLMRQGGMVRTNKPPPLGCTTARQLWVFDLCVDDSHHQSLYFEGNGAASNGTLGDWEGGGII